MDYNISLENEYIPEWNGNKKLPSEQQVKVIWTWPTAYDIEDCVRKEISVNNPVVKIQYFKLVENCVKEIKNLKVCGKILKNGNDILKHPGLADLCNEIRDYIKNKDINEKNL